MIIKGLRNEDLQILKELFKVWRQKLSRNYLKNKYYKGHNALKDLGIAIPPGLKYTNATIGWAAKAVDALAARSRFDGFVFVDDTEDTGIEKVLTDNAFNTLYTQAVTSELIHSCAFLTVSKGSEDEPDVLISAYSAESAAAIWNGRKKRIEAGMTIVETDKNGEPIWVNLYTDDAVITIRAHNNEWFAEYRLHAQGRPLMEPLVYRPSLTRPFGKSRITRAVMSITDSAVRTALRSEVSAEFFTTPQRYLLGAPEDIFDDTSKWDTYIGALLAITQNEDGDTPEYGQLPQMTMQPHVEYMRSLAAQFAGETGIPISSLGVIHDNPSSAEAIYAAKEDLIIEAESLNDTNGNALRTIGMLTLAIMNDTTVKKLDDNLSSITPKFRNPAMPSVVSQSDAIVKQVSAMPWIGETRVALEELGYSEDQVMRLMSDKKRAEGTELINRFLKSNEMTEKSKEPEQEPNVSELI